MTIVGVRGAKQHRSTLSQFINKFLKLKPLEKAQHTQVHPSHLPVALKLNVFYWRVPRLHLALTCALVPDPAAHEDEWVSHQVLRAGASATTIWVCSRNEEKNNKENAGGIFCRLSLIIIQKLGTTWL